MPTLITGVNGFVGSGLARELYNHDEVIGLGFDRHKYYENCTHLVYGDIRDEALLYRTLVDYEIDTVYHLAAQSIVKTCSQDPLSTYDINVMGTVSLLNACLRYGKTKSILVSTSDKAYGSAPIPYNESTPLDPYHIYETSKACQDMIGRSFFHNYGLPVKVARCSNIYGPGDRNYSRIIPGTIRRLLSFEQPVLYNGVGDYRREFVYIDDITKAFCLIAKTGKPGEAYCVGGTPTYRVSEVIDIITELLGSTLLPEIRTKENTFKEIEAQSIDATKLNMLGWRPEWSLPKGLFETIQWYKQELQNAY